MQKQEQKKDCFGKNMPFFVPVFLILFIAGFFIGILWVEKIRTDRVYLNGNLYQVPSTEKTSPKSDPQRESLVGDDRDEHGCIGSAGYSWCEEKGKCLRAWEESCE